MYASLLEQISLEGKASPFYRYPEVYHLVLDILNCFRISIERIKHDLMILPKFNYGFLKVLVMFRGSSNQYALAFADPFQGRFQAATNGPPTGPSCITVCISLFSQAKC
jgi:hypothetical protein